MVTLFVFLGWDHFMKKIEKFLLTCALFVAFSASCFGSTGSSPVSAINLLSDSESDGEPDLGCPLNNGALSRKHALIKVHPLAEGLKNHNTKCKACREIMQFEAGDPESRREEVRKHVKMCVELVHNLNTSEQKTCGRCQPIVDLASMGDTGFDCKDFLTSFTPGTFNLNDGSSGLCVGGSETGSVLVTCSVLKKFLKTSRSLAELKEEKQKNEKDLHRQSQTLANQQSDLEKQKAQIEKLEDAIKASFAENEKLKKQLSEKSSLLAKEGKAKSVGLEEMKRLGEENALFKRHLTRIMGENKSLKLKNSKLTESAKSIKKAVLGAVARFKKAKSDSCGRKESKKPVRRSKRNTKKRNASGFGAGQAKRGRKKRIVG